MFLSRAMFSKFAPITYRWHTGHMTPSAQAAVTAVPTRRARQRAATTGEIKTLARRQLAEQGPGGLSPRALAPDTGTAPPAPYRHFPPPPAPVTQPGARAPHSLAAPPAPAPGGPPPA